ncbi:uncharacterized protein si:dkeyp-50b9.1 isoform X1 [Pygocentrus nattereri]|uniref:N-acetyltransferase domain-containing protein n=1 Tax=Pygocentrus nattereri TaxID=42514 RepID=A0A3B4DPG2_PYGNA|nr:uncharacterized protein si:dkeyp-50b9.1 isoform X1 [Pygocentrus nattereri]XP_037396698.1 uncharacterized protein si:dkeyp-50b9.1 isoform X1 [Pygocentrus nattereri]
MDGCVVRLHSVSFNSRVEGGSEAFTAQPIRVNFHQLLRTSDAPELLPKVKNQDVLMAVVALLDSTLPDVGSQDIHETVHSPRANTIILLRDHADVLEEFSGRSHPDSQGELVSLKLPEASQDHQSDSYQLSELYSESEDSCEESCGSEETDHRWSWEHFCAGVPEFLAAARKRREIREEAGEDGEIPSSAVGVECLLVAAAAYERKTLLTGEKVLQLSLLATRKRYRRCGVGRYIIELLKSQSVCGNYDALLAHADSDAIEFFSHCGLMDDPLLNDKFREVRDEWANTTLMSYLPPFTTELKSRNPGFSLSLAGLEVEVNLARMTALSAYQQQAVCVTRLVREVKTLRDQLELQREEVDMLHNELEREKEKRHKIEQMFLEYKLRKTWQLLEGRDSDRGSQTDSGPTSPAEAKPEPGHSA